MGDANHLDFLFVAHACFFEVCAEVTVDEANGGEVLDADEADGFQLLEEFGHGTEGVGAADAGEDGGVVDDGEDFVCLRLLASTRYIGQDVGAYHLNHNLISIRVRHQPSQRASSGHAETTRIVDENEVSASLLDEFGREANACIISFCRRPYLSWGGMVPAPAPTTMEPSAIVLRRLSRTSLRVVGRGILYTL